jgi:hypothetical protein
LAPIVFNYWHLVLIFPAAVLPVLVWIYRTFIQGFTVSLQLILVIAAILIATNLVAINDSRKFSWSASYADQVRQYVDQQFGSAPR